MSQDTAATRWCIGRRYEITDPAGFWPPAFGATTPCGWSEHRPGWRAHGRTPARPFNRRCPVCGGHTATSRQRTMTP